MIDYSKSIAFSRGILNQLNSFLSKIGQGRLFFVWHYNPKGFEKQANPKLNFLTMMLNINSLFFDCMPWFLCTKPNQTGKCLGDIIKDMTSIDYKDVKEQVITINQLRNRLCHNTSKFDFEVINEVFGQINSSITIKDWLSLNCDDELWEACINYFLPPIDKYFNNLLDYFKKNAVSNFTYDENDWNVILKSSYNDEDFINNIKLYILPDLYDLRKADNKMRVNIDKKVQIKKWRNILNYSNISPQIAKNDLCGKKIDFIRPEKYFLYIIQTIV